jgi:hypothetical protein
MNVRIVVIEADAVNAGDIEQLLTRAFGASKVAGVLPPPTPSPAAIEGVAPVRQRRLAAPKPAKPKAKYHYSGELTRPADNAKPEKKKESNQGPRPKVAAIVQCSKCGAEADPDQDRRGSCKKCGAYRSWEKIPARTPELAEA